MFVLDLGHCKLCKFASMFLVHILNLCNFDIQRLFADQFPHVFLLKHLPVLLTFRKLNLILVLYQIHQIHLYQRGIRKWNQTSFPPERIRKLVVVPNLPKTVLGKLAIQSLQQMISENSDPTLFE